MFPYQDGPGFPSLIDLWVSWKLSKRSWFSITAADIAFWWSALEVFLVYIIKKYAVRFPYISILETSWLTSHFHKSKVVKGLLNVNLTLLPIMVNTPCVWNMFLSIPKFYHLLKTMYLSPTIALPTQVSLTDTANNNDNKKSVSHWC